MDDTAMKSLKNAEVYLKNIKTHETLLKHLIDTNERIAQSLANIEKMMADSWGAYSHTLEETERAARRVKAN